MQAIPKPCPLRRQGDSSTSIAKYSSIASSGKARSRSSYVIGSEQQRSKLWNFPAQLSPLAPSRRTRPSKLSTTLGKCICCWGADNRFNAKAIKPGFVFLPLEELRPQHPSVRPESAARCYPPTISAFATPRASSHRASFRGMVYTVISEAESGR